MFGLIFDRITFERGFFKGIIFKKIDLYLI